MIFTPLGAGVSLDSIYTTLTTNHHILYNLHSDKEQGGEECRKRTKFFLTNILLDIEVLARGLDLFCIYCIVVESV